LTAARGFCKLRKSWSKLPFPLRNQAWKEALCSWTRRWLSRGRIGVSTLRRCGGKAQAHPGRYPVFPVALRANAYKLLPEANFIGLRSALRPAFDDFMTVADFFGPVRAHFSLSLNFDWDSMLAVRSTSRTRAQRSGMLVDGHRRSTSLNGSYEETQAQGSVRSRANAWKPFGD
jgi:hypothetical protein